MHPRRCNSAAKMAALVILINFGLVASIAADSDSDQLESEGLSGPGTDGILALNPAVFLGNVKWKQIKPSCGFRHGTVDPAKYAPPHDKGDFYIQCEEGASSVSLNAQEYFPIPPAD